MRSSVRFVTVTSGEPSFSSSVLVLKVSKESLCQSCDHNNVVLLVYFLIGAGVLAVAWLAGFPQYPCYRVTLGAGRT